MNTAQAAALMSALAGQSIPSDAQQRFPGGSQVWNIAVPATTVLTGDQIAALATYCDANGLSISIALASLVVT